jgi:hypothetical protein
MNSHIRKNEKGIALLFTLGILSVLLVIALAFATSSITERKAAANNAELTSARLLAESAIQRAIAALRYYDASDPTAAPDVMFSQCPSGADTFFTQNDKTFDTLWRLATEENNITYYTWPPSYLNNDNAMHWVYIHDSSDPDNRIIGRMAYYVKASGGKLDPSSCVTQSTVYPLQPTAAVSAATIQQRPGINLCEINPKGLEGDTLGYFTAGVPTVITKMSSNAVANGKLPDGTRWPDFDTFFGKVNGTTAQKQQFSDWFACSQTPDDEAFWLDGGSSVAGNDNNGSQNASGGTSLGELYNRFNLARTDWTTVATRPTVTSILGTPEHYVLGSSFADGTSIPWLSNFGKLPLPDITNNAFTLLNGTDDETQKGNYPTVAARRNQIAANLIAYCGGTASITDYSEATTPSTVTYMGNQCTPRINELYVGVEAVTVPGGSSGAWTNQLIINAWVGNELVNIYGNNFGAATLTLNYTVTATIATGNATAALSDLNYSTSGTFIVPADPLNNNLNTMTIGENSYKCDATTYKIYDKTASGTGGVGGEITIAVTDVIVTITEAKLTYGGNVVDYAYVNKTIPTLATLQAATSATFDQLAYFGGVQDNDPREHLFASEWSAGAVSVVGAGPAYAYAAPTGTPNAANSSVTMNNSAGAITTQDMEIGNDPSYDFTNMKPRLSTAFIRGAHMQSPWELGFIHRGAPWQTLNIHVYSKDDLNNGKPNSDPSPDNKKFGVSYNMGGRDGAASGGIKAGYAQGDANILDQIKMNSSQSPNIYYGKVNIRAPLQSSLNALLANINTGIVLSNAVAGNGGNTNPHSGSGTIVSTGNGSTGTFAETLATAIYDFPSINGFPSRPLTRASIANVPALSDKSIIAAQTTKAAQDEIIGKFINLTKTSLSDQFTIVAIAQTIKDVGGRGVQTITIAKDINADGKIDNTSVQYGILYNPTTGIGDPSNWYWNPTTASATNTGCTPAVGAVFNESISTCKIGQYDLGADEILAEQKVLCVVKKDPTTGKWSIVSYQYCE